MTTNHANFDNIDLDAVTASATEILRRRIDAIEESKAEQPARLAAARAAADEARGWSLIEEPFAGHVNSIDSVDGTATLSLPSVAARELWGARLCFDLLDCGDNYDQIDEVIARLFSTVEGDTGIAMVIMSAALSTIAGLVVPQLLDEIEQGGSNWDERVRLCEARAKAWNGRAGHLNGLQDQAAASGIKPIDGFDIGAAALDGVELDSDDEGDA